MHILARFIPTKLRARLDQTEAARAYRRQKYARALRALNAPVPWNIDQVKASAEIIEIEGWALAPQGDHSRAGFTINGRLFDKIEYPGPRLDIENLFWYYPGARLSSFSCQAGIQRDDWAAGYAVLDYVDRATMKPFQEDHRYFYPAREWLGTSPVPDAARRARVHGGDSLSSFLIEGFSNYKKLQQVLKVYFDRDYDDFASILDWGCGCGRLTRYFKDLQHAALTGADIDEDNIRWNQQHLGFGSFTPIPLHPPTGLPGSAYDLLIGISIFTHLSEKDQFDWLAELARIAAEGAVLLMTVHGDATVCRSNLPSPLFYHLRVTGFLDVGLNPNLAEVLDEQDYYRNTYHTRAYIRENWARYFEIVAILPGFIGNHQDLVILRK